MNIRDGSDNGSGTQVHHLQFLLPLFIGHVSNFYFFVSMSIIYESSNLIKVTFVGLVPYLALVYQQEIIY